MNVSSPFQPNHLHFQCTFSKCFFSNDTNGHKGWKVALHRELKGQRSHFTKKGNLELTLLDLGNNFDHSGLRVTNHSHVVTKPTPNMNVVTGELITLTQVMAEEMVVAFEDDDDVQDKQEPFSPKSKSE